MKFRPDIKNNHSLMRIAGCLIVFGFLVFGYSATHAQTSKIQPLTPESGKLSGNVYVSNDSSAYSSQKVTFGNPNSVSFQSSKNSSSSTVITTGNLSSSSPISDLDYGTNVIWYDYGYGIENPLTDQLYPSVVNLVKNLGVTVLRFPGGIPSDQYNWENAIGPQSQRTDNVIYQEQDTFLPSNFGPDEFGQLLDDTGAVGDITVNFGTGTAQQAADWVQYMTASSKNNPWGELRAKNGHPAPYSIPYWEVGNEQQSLELYWRGGSVVSIGNGKTKCASSDVHLCEYVYGGTTKFENQKALSQDNSSASNGKSSQVYFAKYPPIVANSLSLHVNGKLWQPVTTINSASQDQDVYQLNNGSGEITFGNGAHGAILPKNATVTLSYESGPHDGFIEYYNLMKSADPSAHVCSSYDSPEFMQLMGSTYPYDCIAVHLYGEGLVGTSDPNLFHNELIQQSFSFANTLATEKADIKKYAGVNANNVQIAITEYGVNALTSPTNQPHYHLSQDVALFDANVLKTIVADQIPIAERHFLISYDNSAVPGSQIYVNSQTFADNAIISGPGPNVVTEPGADVIQAFSKLLYGNLVSSNIKNNPEVSYQNGSYPTLSTLATTDDKGHEAILVINLSSSKAISAEVSPSLNSFTSVNAWTLGSSNFLSFNTMSDPSAVNFVKTDAKIQNGKIYATFPTGSITVLQLN